MDSTRWLWLQRVWAFIRHEWRDDPGGTSIIAVILILMICAIFYAATGHDRSVLLFEIQIHAAVNGSER